ncbi:hypothetical protein [Nonomuraea soli]|uniref:Glycosyl transferase n=1 Tax=Nonomuraea soli TaxID=1032476 RepID=A0A7W0CDC2_9ACTN|nr:hypothetical protein [Nonomuraea soli]MBA2888932.1 hypothetical protein [Nonomuraea soli]
MPTILFLVRGHGFGHAARDARIIAALRRRRPDVTVEVLASGSAATYLAWQGIDFTELPIADEWDLSGRAAQVVWETLAGRPRPDLTVCDEVVWALPYCAQVWGRRAILLTDWFFAEIGLPEHDRLLDHAGEIVVLDFSAAHPGPYTTSAPIRCLGPVTAGLSAGRTASRELLGLAPDRKAAVLTVGGMSLRPDNRRIAEAVLTAWRRHSPPGHRLFVLDKAPAQPGSDAGIAYVGMVADPEPYYAAADAVITNAYGTLTCDLVWNRRPVLGLTDPEMPEADSFPRRVAALAERGGIVHAEPSTPSRELWSRLERVMNGERGAADLAGLEWTTGDEVAAHLLRRLDDVLEQA